MAVGFHQQLLRRSDSGRGVNRARNRRTAEHLEARCEGGADSTDNIVAACRFCNGRRHRAKVARNPVRPRTPNSQVADFLNGIGSVLPFAAHCINDRSWHILTGLTGAGMSLVSRAFQTFSLKESVVGSASDVPGPSTKRGFMTPMRHLREWVFVDTYLYSTPLPTAGLMLYLLSRRTYRLKRWSAGAHYGQFE